MSKKNYQKELDLIISQTDPDSPADKKPSLFLHCCCAPCSSYVFPDMGDTQRGAGAQK